MKNLGIGHLKKPKQHSFFKANLLSHGGALRNKRSGRGRRPLSTKESLHLVFKINFTSLRYQSLRSPFSFTLVKQIIKKYSGHFNVKIEQLSIQNDHIHLLLRTSRRSQFHHFFRVVSGQIAQRFKKEGLMKALTDTPIVSKTPEATKKHEAAKTNKTSDTKALVLKTELRLWKYRPFSRVIKGFKAYKTARDYIQLNQQEVLGVIKYQKQRLKGLSSSDWALLWN